MNYQKLDQIEIIFQGLKMDTFFVYYFLAIFSDTVQYIFHFCIERLGDDIDQLSRDGFD